MRNLYFGPFRLEIGPHPHDAHQTLLRLYRDGQFKAVEPLQLRLLHFIADERPGDDLSVEEIAAAVWPVGKGGGNVEKQISLLRKVLGDENRPHKFIETQRDGMSHATYKFIGSVRAEGEVERLNGFPKWSNHRLIERLAKLSRNDDEFEDLRIVTSGLVPSRHDIDLEDYLRAGLRLRIVMMNPDNMPLLKGRYDLRGPDYTAEAAQADIRNQVEYLKRIMARFPADGLQVRLSDAIPSGLIMHTPRWALLGMFPAHGSYVLGPMIEAGAGTSLWQTLYDDWKVRWDNPAHCVTVMRSL